MSSHGDTLSAVYDAAQKCATVQEVLQTGGATVNEITELLDRSIGGTNHYNGVEEYVGELRAGVLAAASASEHLRMRLLDVHGKLGE